MSGSVESVPKKFLKLEEAVFHAQQENDMKRLHLCVMKMLYSLLDAYTIQSKWIGRKLTFLSQRVMSDPSRFPEFFQKMFLKELWRMTMEDQPRLRSLQIDLMLVLDCELNAQVGVL